MRKQYDKQIRAIQPILEASKGREWLNWVLSSDQTTQEKFIHYLIAQGLAGHWYTLMFGSTKAQDKFPQLFSLLERYMSGQQAIYYNQTSVLGKLNNLLESNGITYAVIKGVHIRDVLYSPPWLRPCEDIDILISPKDKFRVAKILIEHGFKARPDIKTIANDLTFSHGHVSVDMHWDILRPGRLKQPLTDHFLSTRIHQNGYFSLTPEAMMFIMLVHPVFKKYLTTPHAYLSRIVDLHNWVKQYSLDWLEILRLCDKNGLKTAAWVTSKYYELLTDRSLNIHLVNNLKPSRIKANYFKYWLQKNIATSFLHNPIIPKLFFTIPAHDSTIRSFRFLFDRVKSKELARQDLQLFQKVLENKNHDRIH